LLLCTVLNISESPHRRYLSDGRRIVFVALATFDILDNRFGSMIFMIGHQVLHISFTYFQYYPLSLFLYFAPKEIVLLRIEG
jgi:hypothetical protein